LLVAAGLMGRSLARLLAQPMGYATADLLTLRIDLSGERYADGPARARFAGAFEESVRALPGVRSVTLWGPSMLGNATWVVSVFPEGRAPAGPDDFVQTFRHSVNPGALANLGLPLRSGRELARSDAAGAPLVAVVSATLARDLWPGEDAVGKRLRRVDPALPPITVVGVAGDAQHRDRYSLGDVAAGIGPCGVGPQRDIYFPFAQRPNPSLTAAVRFSGDDGALGVAIARAVARLDPNLPVSDLALLDRRLVRQASAPAAMAALFVAFAVFAAFLAALGLYGVIAQSIEMRAREIGIRLALGARAGALVRREVRVGSAFACAGVALGVLAAGALARFLEALLFGVSARDPWTFAGAVGFLVALAAVTAYVPARLVVRRGAMLALRE
jgi:putative ABC transport system permease protein